jgi:hypothetical protein
MVLEHKGRTSMVVAFVTYMHIYILASLHVPDSVKITSSYSFLQSPCSARHQAYRPSSPP